MHTCPSLFKIKRVSVCLEHTYRIHEHNHTLRLFTIWVEIVKKINLIRKALTAEIAEQAAIMSTASPVSNSISSL